MYTFRLIHLIIVHNDTAQVHVAIHTSLFSLQMIKAQRAVVEMRGRHLRVHGAHTSGRLRLQTDYASHECRNFFFEQCKKAGIDVRKQSELNNSNVNAASPKIADHHVSR